MPKTMSVYEAKCNFSRLLEGVERDGDVVTITRYGQPIAHISPIAFRQERDLAPLPGFEGKIKINCDLFADDNWQDWEALNG